MQFSAILTPFAALVCLALTPTWGTAQNQPVGRSPDPIQAQAASVILDMSQAFKKGDSKRLSALLPQARGHVLEPWAAYWELRSRLDTAPRSEIEAFLSRYAGSYQEDRLRNDWLLMLGQRRDWATFAAEHPNYRMSDDREVKCYALTVGHGPAGADLPLDIKRLWYAQREADDGCAYAAAQMHDASRLSDNEVWVKARLAVEANRPRMARQALEMIGREALAPLNDIQENPARYLAKHKPASGANHSLSQEWAVLAVVRLASTDAEAAADALQGKLAKLLTPEQRSWAWGAIGKSAAQRLSNDAMRYYAQARDSDLSDDQLAWKVRAALRKGDWKQVQTAIQAMSDQARTDAAWVYWRATAQHRQAKTDADHAEANKALQSIAGVRGFYEQLALEDLGQSVVMPQRPTALTPQEQDAARSNPGLRRSLAAIQIGLRSEGVREWNYTTNLHTPGGMSDRELLAAADLACQNEVWDRCINTSERTKNVIDVAQRYPVPFRDSVVQRSNQIGLDPAYVYGLIRQESRFVMDARSGVGASGLMQVMPATAKWTARKIGMNDFQPHLLSDRETNIAIGTGYLKLVLDDFSGSMPLAAAAYNAGPSRSRAWRGQTGDAVLDAAVWAENVPFSETRDYVKKVLSNTTAYAALLTGLPQSLKARLGRVGPRDASTEVDKDLP